MLTGFFIVLVRIGQIVLRRYIYILLMLSKKSVVVKKINTMISFYFSVSALYVDVYECVSVNKKTVTVMMVCFSCTLRKPEPSYQ